MVNRLKPLLGAASPTAPASGGALVEDADANLASRLALAKDAELSVTMTKGVPA
jgi:hypothetical protein